MKKYIALILTAILALTFVSCSQKPLSEEKIAENYTLLEENAKDLYFEVIDSLTSGELSFEYSGDNGVSSTTVKFSSLDNGEKQILAEIKYLGGDTAANYFDGEKFYVIVNGEGAQIEAQYIENKSLYRNLLGAPEEYFSESTTGAKAYKKNDNSAYLIRNDIDFGEEGTAHVEFVLDKNQLPEKLTIYNVFSEDDITITTVTYSKLGEKISITAPEFKMAEE